MTSIKITEHLNAILKVYELMWSERPEIWKRYEKDVLAVGNYDADFLYSYIRYATVQKVDVKATAVIDLQKYKHISKFNLVKTALKQKKHEPFVFFYVLN